MSASDAEPRRRASLLVVDPAGHRSRVAIEALPFRIGRHAANELILRDNRASRNHARIVIEGGVYFVEDAGSRHGVFVNGKRVTRQALESADRIEFGFPDSYQLVFAWEGAELSRLMDQFAAQDKEATLTGTAPGGSLARLRAVLEVARTLQTGFALQDVLGAVVDAAMAITGAERGFLLLRQGEDLEARVARGRGGASIDPDDLRVPRRVIRRALDDRRDLLSMNFDPAAASGIGPEQSVAELDLRSCVCVPLVRIRSVFAEETSMFSTGGETVGVLYMDSRAAAADLARGNRELLQSLAIEASTVLENARLLEEERTKHKMDEELRVARVIQQSLLPRALPVHGWFRAAASSVASYAVGGDYYDAIQVEEGCWSAVVADVSGKGVSSALLASLLEGAFLGVATRVEGTEQRFARINHFLNDRTGGEKYATVFFCSLERDGALHYINAGHCAPLVARRDGTLESLDPTGMPVGLMDFAAFAVASTTLSAGEKVVIYTDGITDAQSPEGEYFGRKRLRDAIRRSASGGCAQMHDAIREAVSAFTADAPQADDLTLLVLEYGAE
jgi:serine phosphatase RsbU (regulator of sigma subunit)